MTSPTPLPLIELPVSRLIPLLARRHRAHIYEPLRELGLAPGQELLLMQVWENGPQRPVELAQALTVTGPTVTKMVSRLEEAGYVTRARDPRDARAAIVSLTPEGVALWPAVEDIWQGLEERTLRSLDAADRHALTRLLSQLITDLDDSPAISLEH